MAGKRHRAFSILGVIAWLAASCSSAPAPEPEPAEQPTATSEDIYLELSEADRAAAAAAVQEALENTASSQALAWDGPDGIAGLVTPLRTFKIKTGHFCREFIEAIASGPKLRSVRQTACRDQQGHWQRVQP